MSVQIMYRSPANIIMTESAPALNPIYWPFNSARAKAPVWVSAPPYEELHPFWPEGIFPATLESRVNISLVPATGHRKRTGRWIVDFVAKFFFVTGFENCPRSQFAQTVMHFWILGAVMSQGRPWSGNHLSFSTVESVVF